MYARKLCWTRSGTVPGYLFTGSSGAQNQGGDAGCDARYAKAIKSALSSQAQKAYRKILLLVRKPPFHAAWGVK